MNFDNFFEQLQLLFVVKNLSIFYAIGRNGERVSYNIFDLLLLACIIIKIAP